MIRMGHQTAFTVLMVLITLLSLMDIYHDHGDGPFTLHNLTEFSILFAAVASLLLLWRSLGARLERTVGELNSTRKELADFRARHGDTLRHMRQAIQEQFRRWQFTPAETKIAELLIRGYSLKQIAGLLQKSDRTVRNQATALYNKAGMVGRNELAAFFFMDVLGESELE